MMKTTMKPHGRHYLTVVASTLVLSLFCCAPSDAGLIFGTGVYPGPDVLLNTTAWVVQDSLTATGQIGGNTVIQAVSDVTLTAPAAGQARIEAATTPFTSVTFTPMGIYPYFDAIEMNVTYAGTAGLFTLTVVDNNMNTTVSDPFTLAMGQNRVWADATMGHTIKSITVDAFDSNGVPAALIANIQQVRVVPEPTALILVGSIIGLGAFRRRR